MRRAAISRAEIRVTTRARYDDGSLTLAHFLQSSYLLREAALVPSIWKTHYEMRYEHCDEDREAARREATGNNWQKMYFQRRQLDYLALLYLEKIVLKRVGRQETAEALFRLYMDVWDVLELESQCPVPELLANRADEFIGLRVPRHAITRRYWAKSMLDTISRGHAIDVWRTFWIVPSSYTPSFELTMSSLSCFFGQSEKRITAQFDDLAKRCSEELAEKGVRVDVEAQENHDVSAICMSICSFMQSQGFSVYRGNVMNNFPHAFLTTNKQTLPICLVHIFTAIATRLGLNASPIDFPGTVLAHVLPRHEGAEPIIVNASSSRPTNTILNSQINNATHLPLLPGIVYSTIFHSCTGLLMLRRASRNILSSLMSIHNVHPSIRHPSLLLSICVHLLFQEDDDNMDRLLVNAYLHAWDCIFLLDRLAPPLMSRYQGMIRSRCQTVLDTEAAEELNIHSRTDIQPVKYFVGMAVVHASVKCVGFIFGWDTNSEVDWAKHPSVTTVDVVLPYERNQPHYYVFFVNGLSRYVAEDNISPVAFTKEHVEVVFRTCAEFSVDFDGGADFPSEPHREGNIEHVGARGRLHMSPQAHYAYPDDEAVGLRWLKHGVFP